MSDEMIECTSEEGITIGLIDSMIAVANSLNGRDLTHPGVIEALEDFRSNRNVQFIIAKVIGATTDKLIKSYQISEFERLMSPK